MFDTRASGNYISIYEAWFRELTSLLQSSSWETGRDQGDVAAIRGQDRD